LQIIGNKKDGEKIYDCKCLECKSKFPKIERQLSAGSGCPVCANKKVAIGINDMWTTAPELAELLYDKNDGYKYTKLSSKKVNWVCPICGEIIYDKIIKNIYKQGLACPVCGKSKSYPNRLMYALLSYLHINFKNEKGFKWSKDKKYDFYLKDYNTIIEMHGQQHYDKDMYGQSYMTIQKNDKVKEDLANKNNITKYIIIDSRHSTIDWIKDKIENSELSNILNLDQVDWLDVERQTQINPMKEACKLWDSGEHNFKVIAKEIGYNPSMVSEFLRKGYRLGITTYTPEISRKIGNISQVKTKYNKLATPFICVETGQCFGSVSICSKLSESLFMIKLETTVISKTLKNKIKSLNSKKQGKPIHLQYITREEFNKIKQESPELAFGDFFILSNQKSA
jgi:hypothetical protein